MDDSDALAASFALSGNDDGQNSHHAAYNRRISDNQRHKHNMEVYSDTNENI